MATQNGGHLNLRTKPVALVGGSHLQAAAEDAEVLLEQTLPPVAYPMVRSHPLVCRQRVQALTQQLVDFFSPEQWRFLAEFMGNMKISDERMTGEFDFNSWIIDTGASRHVTCSSSWLFNVHNTSGSSKREIRHCHKRRLGSFS